MAILLTVIATLLLFLNLVLNFPFVQTGLTHAVSGYFSRKFHAKIHIGKVDFEFLKKLVLRDVYIQDLHSDTLLYATDLKFDIGELSFKSHQLYLSNIEIDKAKVYLVTYKNEHSLNLQFLIDGFASKDTSKSTGPSWNVSFGKLSLNNIAFRLQNQNDTDIDNYGINFSTLNVRAIYSRINTIRFMGDTIRATIESFSAKEKSGFTLNKLACFVSVCPRGMELDALKIETPNTSLSTDLIFTYNGFSAFDDFTNSVDMKANFHKSKICFEDIGYFAHGLRAVRNCFTLSGEYNGTVNHLTAHKMSIGWGKFSTLEGEAQLDHITDMDSAIMKVNITTLVTSKPEIENLPLPPFDKENHITLPDNLSKLNVIHFSGFFDGSISSFKAAGNITTDIGDISANLHLWEDAASKETHYTGSLGTKDFNLGYFWNITDFGTISASVSIGGKGLKKENADDTLSGVIQSLTYRKYTYQNTTLRGELKKGFFSGLVKITDPHLLLDFNGKVNIASQNSVFQFDSHITKANLSALHIIKDTSMIAILSGHIKVNATGNNLDNMIGSIHIDSTTFSIRKESYYLDSLTLTSSMEDGYHTLTLKSDYADGELSGHFRIDNTPECLQNLLASYIPSIFNKEKYVKEDKDGHDYSLTLHFNENTGLTNLFLPGLKIAQGTVIKGMYDESDDNFSLNGTSDEIDISAKKIKKWKINATGNESSLVFKSGCDTLYISDSLYAAHFKFNGDVTKDTLHYILGWNDDSANFATIPGYVGFPGKSRIAFKFLHPVISMVDSVWKINNDNFIVYDSSRVEIKSFTISHSNHFAISLQGAISNNSNDQLNIGLHNINLASLKLGNTPLEGEVNGSASISNLFSHPFFTSSLTFSSLYFNKQYVGDGTINSSWDTLSQSITVDGNLSYHGSPVFSVKGKYVPSGDDNNLNMDASFTGFPTKLFQPYIKDVSSILDGSITGQAHISGAPGKPLVNGNVIALLKKMKFDYLNTSYHSPGINIKITPDTFKVLPSVLLDEKNDTAIYSGVFTHRNFKELKMDFNLNARNFLCLNTSEVQNTSYFGKAFVTGNMRIYGLLDALHIEATVSTTKNTVFNIPLESASELDQANYIQFTGKGKTKKAASDYKVNLTGIQMDFTIHVTSDATSRILFSNRGEVLEGHGYGRIQFSMDNIGDINMRGNYTVTGGYYNFVLQNIINKKFILQPGGNIDWNGDPYNADINLTTQYETRASLQPFFPQDPTGYNKRVPVDCDLGLSGKLTSPDIAFTIDLPTVDNDTKQVVESYLSNADELTTQVFGLLIINSFMPVNSGIGGNGFGNQLGVANSAEILSNQLTNMFNNINKNFNVGLDIQPGSTINPAEYKLALSTALFNGRVNVSTDVGTMSGVPTSAQTGTSNNNFVGELNVEVKLNKNGKLSAKAFNKANDNTTLNALNAPYTQGVGLSYKKGFSTWKEFWLAIFGKKSKTVSNPDGESE